MNRKFGKLIFTAVVSLLIALAIGQANRRPGPCPICGHDWHQEGFKQSKTP